MSKIIKLIVSLFAFLLLACFVLIIILLIKYDFNFKEVFGIGESTNLVKEYEFDNEKDINIMINTGNVYLKSSDNNKFKVQLYSDKLEEEKIEEENNRVDILLKEEKLGFFKKILNHKVGAIYVYLPKEFESKIIIDCNVGDIKVDNYIYASLKISLDVGDIEIGEIKDLEIKNNIGDIDINKINSYLDIDVDTGDVEINEANLTRNSKIVVNVGEVEIKKAGDLYIEAKSDVGKVDINNNNKDSDVTLDIRVDVGEISVNNIKGTYETKYIKELDIYQKIDLEKVTSVDVIRFLESGDNRQTYTAKEDIQNYYNMVGNTKIGRETTRACDDNTTVYTFNMGSDKVSFEYECDWLVINNKRYLIIK